MPPRYALSSPPDDEQPVLRRFGPHPPWSTCKLRTTRPELDGAMDEVLQGVTNCPRAPRIRLRGQTQRRLQLDAHVVGCGNNTDALYLALRALGVGPGDEVIVPDFSFIATAKSWLKSMPPRLRRHRPTHLQPRPRLCRARHSARTKAVIVVNLGQCADMDALVPWAQTHGLHIVEDNAQSLGRLLWRACAWPCRHPWRRGVHQLSRARTLAPLATAAPSWPATPTGRPSKPVANHGAERNTTTSRSASIPASTDSSVLPQRPT